MKGTEATAHKNNKPFGTKIKVNTCINFVLARLFEELEEEGVCIQKGLLLLCA